MSRAVPEPLFLVHGGLWEDMDAARFWVRTGVSTGLAGRGFAVLAPDRLHHPPDWTAEVEHLSAALPERPVTVIAASNGCAVAVRLALAHPDRVARLLLAWPATAGDPVTDAGYRRIMLAGGADEETVARILVPGILRGVTAADLAALRCPVAVLPAAGNNPYHRPGTVDEIVRLLPGATVLPAFPEPPRPGFAPRLGDFLDTVTGWVRGA